MGIEQIMEGEEKPCAVNEDFVCKKHVKFFKRCLDILPSAYSSLDTSRFVIRSFSANNNSLRKTDGSEKYFKISGVSLCKFKLKL